MHPQRTLSAFQYELLWHSLTTHLGSVTWLHGMNLSPLALKQRRITFHYGWLLYCGNYTDKQLLPCAASSTGTCEPTRHPCSTTGRMMQDNHFLQLGTTWDRVFCSFQSFWTITCRVTLQLLKFLPMHDSLYARGVTHRIMHVRPVCCMMFAACWLLVVAGCWLLVVGYWFVGCWCLVVVCCSVFFVE